MKMMNRRLRFAGVHLVLSGLVALVVSLGIFIVWYPTPYWRIAGGLTLFGLLIGVDVVLGPLLTLIAAGDRKPVGELKRDFLIIVMVQAAALAYGIHTIAVARPVFLSYEIDLMRVVTAADVEAESLIDAPQSLRSLSWTGPRMIASVKPTDPVEIMQSVQLALAGFDLSMVPKNWREFEPYAQTAWDKAKPAAKLIAKYPDQRDAFLRVCQVHNVSLDGLRFMPLLSRGASSTVLLVGPEARVVGYLTVDGFI